MLCRFTHVASLLKGGFFKTLSCFSHISDKPSLVTELADGSYPKTGFKKKLPETKTMTFRKKKTIVWFMALLCFIAFIASTEARAYPAAGYQNQSANSTTFFESTNAVDDKKAVQICGKPCCPNLPGKCDQCCVPAEIQDIEP